MNNFKAERLAKNSAFYAVILICAALLFLRDTIKIKITAGFEAQPELPKIELDAVTLHSQIMQHSRLEDSGLTNYRDALARESVVTFYTGITGSEVITQAILTGAEENDIPLSLAFALAYVESGYKIKAVNKNRNTSIDRGLFQLNNKTFTKLSEKDFFDPNKNAKYGLSHLRFCLNTAGNEVAALAMYNAGTTRVKSGSTPQVTLNYVSKIQAYRAGLEELFKNRLPQLIAAAEAEKTEKIHLANVAK